jgi:hypothetical protein
MFVTEVFNNGGSAGGTLTLSVPAQAIKRIVGLIGAATSVAATTATVVTAAPTGTQAQFTGTAEAPSNTVTLGSGWAANSILLVTYQPAGAFPSDK